MPFTWWKKAAKHSALQSARSPRSLDRWRRSWLYLEQLETRACPSITVTSATLTGGPFVEGTTTPGTLTGTIVGRSVGAVPVPRSTRRFGRRGRDPSCL